MAMVYIISGCVLVFLVMLDITRTTLTTKGEGLVSSIVSRAFRQFATLVIRKGHRMSEVTGAISLLALGTVWLAGLWAGWVLIFLGLPEALDHSGPSTVEFHDVVYFVGFTLSTLGIGGVTPEGAPAQMATTLASFNGLLVITLIVTYALSVVSGAVARRVLAYKIHLADGEEGGLLAAFPSIEEFAVWAGDIKKELISCTEQRLAYPVLDNFVSKEDSHSLAIQLAKLGLASLKASHNGGADSKSGRELQELLTVLYRYTSLTGLTDDELADRLEKLGSRDGWLLNP